MSLQQPIYVDIMEFFCQCCLQCRSVVARTSSARHIKVWLHHREELLLFWNSELAARRILGIALEETLGYTLIDLERVETNTVKTIPIASMMLGAYHSKLLQPSVTGMRTINFGQALNRINVNHQNNWEMRFYENEELRGVSTCYVRLRGEVNVDEEGKTTTITLNHNPTENHNVYFGMSTKQIRRVQQSYADALGEEDKTHQAFIVTQSANESRVDFAECFLIACGKRLIGDFVKNRALGGAAIYVPGFYMSNANEILGADRDDLDSSEDVVDMIEGSFLKLLEITRLKEHHMKFVRYLNSCASRTALLHA